MTTPPLRNLCLATRSRIHSWISPENATDSAPGCGFAFGTTYALCGEDGKEGWGTSAGGGSGGLVWGDEPWQFSGVFFGIHPDDSCISDLRMVY